MLAFEPASPGRRVRYTGSADDLASIIPVPGAITRVAEDDEEPFMALENYTFADSLVDMGGEWTAHYPDGIEATGEEAPVRQ